MIHFVLQLFSVLMLINTAGLIFIKAFVENKQWVIWDKIVSIDEMILLSCLMFIVFATGPLISDIVRYITYDRSNK